MFQPLIFSFEESRIRPLISDDACSDMSRVLGFWNNMRTGISTGLVRKPRLKRLKDNVKNP